MLEVAKAFRYEVAKNLRQVPVIRRALGEIKKDPTPFNVRVEEFDEVIEGFNYLLEDPEINPEWYQNMVKYRELADPNHATFGISPINTVELYKDGLEYAVDDGNLAEVSEELVKGFGRVRGKIDNGEWSFVREGVSLNKLISGLLIEGWGLEVADLTQKPEVARAFVLAFEEFLLLDRPQSVIFNDIVDWMIEEKADFSPNARALLTRREWRAMKESGEVDLGLLTRHLNYQFRNGRSVVDDPIIEDIRLFPRPIAVDFNNVLVNNKGELVPNPEAEEFLASLREIGNVFIVTSARGWDEVQAVLANYGLWDDDTRLMTADNYEFMRTINYRGRQKLVNEHIRMLGKSGQNLTEDDYLLKTRAWKLIGPIFGKPWDVPLIDDSEHETTSNPGVLGITVERWEPEEENCVRGDGRLTLQEAVEKVRTHYERVLDSN